MHGPCSERPASKYRRSLIKLSCLILLVLLAANPVHAGDTIVARVGERIITLEDLQKTINSTPYGIPDVRHIQPDKREIVIGILQDMIHAELLYNEAIRLGIPQSAPFRQESRAYRTALLAAHYRQYFTDKTVALDSTQVPLSNQQRRERLAAESGRLFERYNVQYSPEVAQKDPGTFADDTVLVTASMFTITFGDIKQALKETGNTKAALVDILSQSVEQELFASRAIELSLDPGVAADLAAYEKSLAVSLLREQLDRQNEPTPEETAHYLKNNEYLLYKPQIAHVLLIVAPTEKEADSLREKALHGGNFYELASEHSIAPDAKTSAGRINPLIIGERPYTPIDKALLSIAPGGITPPIQGDKGYSIFKLLDITPPEQRDEGETRDDAARAIREQKMSAHLTSLLQTTKTEIYPVF